MTTPYEDIYLKFIKRLKNDDDLFNYHGLNDEEVEALVQEHLDALLDRAISYIYKFGNPDVNLYDRDDANRSFNHKLVPQEIDLLADVMFLQYYQEQRNKIKALGLTFRSSELNVFSPANERKTTLEMINRLELVTDAAIQNYLSRDRNTWNYKSIYGSG